MHGRGQSDRQGQVIGAVLFLPRLVIAVSAVAVIAVAWIPLWWLDQRRR